MEQIRNLFCMCDSGVARRQSQDQCHFWQMKWMFKSVLYGQVSLAAVNQICVIDKAMNGCKNLRVH